MIKSVAYYAKNNEGAAAVLVSDEIRRRALALCYAIPGYTEMARGERNRVYDAKRKEIEAELPFNN